MVERARPAARQPPSQARRSARRDGAQARLVVCGPDLVQETLDVAHVGAHGVCGPATLGAQVAFERGQRVGTDDGHAHTVSPHGTSPHRAVTKEHADERRAAAGLRPHHRARRQAPRSPLTSVRPRPTPTAPAIAPTSRACPDRQPSARRRALPAAASRPSPRRADALRQRPSARHEPSPRVPRGSRRAAAGPRRRTAGRSDPAPHGHGRPHAGTPSAVEVVPGLRGAGPARAAGSRSSPDPRRRARRTSAASVTSTASRLAHQRVAPRRGHARDRPGHRPDREVVHRAPRRPC